MRLFELLFGTTPPAVVAEEKKPATIYELARTVNDRFEEVAHPAELLSDPAFLAAASRVAERDLVVFTLGENATVASLALLALAQRGDASAIESILESINSYSGRWTKFFALEALDRLVPAPRALLGRLFVALDDDWSDGYDRFLLQFIKDFARRRVTAGEPATFDNALPSAAHSRLDDVSTLLEKLDASLAPMRKELTAFRDGKANVRFLRTIGKIVEEDAVLVEDERLVEAVQFMVQTLAAERRRSVLVSGDEGTGKSTIIRAAADRLRHEGWTIFEASAMDVIAGRSYIGEVEERLQKMTRTMRAARRVVWIIPNLHEMQYAGAHSRNPHGLLDLILPDIISGNVVVIGEINSAAHQRLLQQNRRVASAFVNVRIEALQDDDARKLACRWIALRGEGRITDEVLAEAWPLASQYLGMRAAPGNILQLLELTLTRIESGPVSVDDILATLAQITGLPISILDERDGLDLAALREHFEDRILGQPEAIDVLVERVAMIKAGVTDPTRPFGVFLFAGATGTGKTEIAKTLAEYLFGSSTRLVRIDMSEMQTSESLSRLVGDDDASTRSLVDEIRKQPFSVILLDEMEKAHPRALDLFLQVFDDGRLTDCRGNTADFRHAIIILTSNLRTGGRAGFGSDASAATTALGKELRKEFINRLDRVVTFRPLSRETMRGIVQKELVDALQRRGLRNRNWVVEWDDSAIELLLSAGFTDDLGARPLKRAVERLFLTPLAERIVSRRVPSGEHFVFVRADGIQLAIDFIDAEPVVVEATVSATALAHSAVGGDAAGRGARKRIARMVD